MDPMTETDFWVICNQYHRPFLRTMHPFRAEAWTIAMDTWLASQAELEAAGWYARPVRLVDREA